MTTLMSGDAKGSGPQFSTVPIIAARNGRVSLGAVSEEWTNDRLHQGDGAMPRGRCPSPIINPGLNLPSFARRRSLNRSVHFGRRWGWGPTPHLGSSLDATSEANKLARFFACLSLQIPCRTCSDQT